MRFKIDSELLVRADGAGRERMREYIVGKYPRIKIGLIARSILSRPIEAYFIGEGRKYIAVVAAHHALESITANFAFALIDYLLTKSRTDSINGVDCKFLLSKYCFCIVPCVNPDGIELRFNGVWESPLSERLTRMSGGDFTSWQANARGVDLNHNYDAGFAEYKAIEREREIVAGATLYSGESPESEPETRGVANLVRMLMPSALVSLHSQGEEIYAFPRTPSVLRCAARISALSGYRLSEPTGTAAYGGLCDYSSSLGIPSFTLELGRGENPLDESQLPLIFSRVADAIVLLPTFLG
jgi:g-D-glutamyl-meso-diaminopimelate peptidase